jgi:hypothetical protein
MIKLKTKIKGKEIELDLISLKDKTVAKNSKELAKKGITKKDLQQHGVTSLDQPF